MAGTLVLLGPQRPDPNAPTALEELPGAGPIAVISAGWQHDESDEQVLRKHLGPQASVIPLYAWFDRVMREHPAIRDTWRVRQDALIRLRQLHRGRLRSALQAVRELLPEAHDAIGRSLLRRAQDHVRRLDAELVAESKRIHQTHGRPWDEVPQVQAYREEALERLRSARAVAMVGGHVAVLRNRLGFFGVGPALRQLHREGLSVVAWSAGSMVLTERVVLYYDDPPDGPADPELLERGFPLVRDLVLLPHARQRLRLDDPERVKLLASRFAPAVCLGLENGAWLVRQGGAWFNRGRIGSAVLLRPSGVVEPLPRVEAT